MATSDVDTVLAEIEARAEAATFGPWHAGNGCTAQGLASVRTRNNVRGNWWVAEIHGGAMSATPELAALLNANGGMANAPLSMTKNHAREDAAFIANARTDVPRLVAALRWAMKEAVLLGKEGGQDWTEEVEAGVLALLRGSPTDRGEGGGGG